MPCFTIQKVSVDLGKVHPDYLMTALQELKLAPVRDGAVIYFGNGEQVNTQTGQAKLASFRDVAEIKRAYSKAVVMAQAKRFGWGVKQTGNNQWQLLKASL